MAGRYIAKCTPSLGEVSIWWSRCTETILWPNSTTKGLFYLRDKVGGEVAEVRNGIVDAVLQADLINPISHLFWLDDDVLVFPGCLRELLSHDVPIASGVYFTKEEDFPEPLIYRERNGGADIFVPDKVCDVWGHGMGLALVQTEVYKRMRDELDLGKDKYNRPQWYKTSKDCDTSQDEKGNLLEGFTEDLYFCENASKLGYKPLVSTHKHAFGFHYERRPMVKKDDQWFWVGLVDFHSHRGEKQMMDYGYPPEQWRSWIQGDPITWKTKEGPVIWT